MSNGRLNVTLFNLEVVDQSKYDKKYLQAGKVNANFKKAPQNKSTEPFYFLLYIHQMEFSFCDGAG